MPKNVCMDSYYKCEQAVIEKIGVQNLEKTIKIGVKIKKYFKNSYELMQYLYKFGQRNKFIWLQDSSFELDVDLNNARCMY